MGVVGDVSKMEIPVSSPLNSTSCGPPKHVRAALRYPDWRQKVRRLALLRLLRLW